MNINPALLQRCHEQPIHRPGRVQSHGALVAWDGGLVVAISPGLSPWLGTEGTLGQPIAALLPDSLRQAAETVEDGLAASIPLTVPLGFLRHTSVHALRLGTLVVLEFEETPPPSLADPTRFAVDAVGHLQAVTDEPGLCQIAVDLVRRATGHDRVMVYRFEPSGDGSVVAESLAEGLDPYLGLHYPASDVPEQARRLYLVNRLRCLADTDDPGVPVNGRDLDLSGLRLRCHAPVYKEYLRSMGARASLVASLVVDGVLWGLIIANHRTPRLPAAEDRAAGNLVATLLSGRLADAERTRRLTLAARVSNLEGRLRLAFDAGGDLQRALDLVATDAVDLVGASGLALHQTGCWLTAGATPDVSTLESLRTHLTPRLLDGHVVADDGRDATLKALRTPGGPCGILARTLGVAGEALLLWFRPEWQHEVAWAGDPADTAKQVRTAQDGGYELGPRASFARWVESVTGRSRPWRSIDREAAACCSTALIGPILRSEAVRQTALARDLQHERDLRQVQDNLNQLLERRNQDLQSLIYMISHDLRSPLVNLQGFSSELERSLGELSILLQRYGALLPPTARASIQSTLSIDLPESLTYITASTERMDRLLKGLLSISRLGQAAVHPQPITLAAVMQDILASRRFQIAEAGAEVHLGELPLVQADPVLIGQVLGNLVDNALKYRHAERPLHLRISGGIDGAWAWASVTDNGCGIRPEHLKRIFIPFQRGEGTHDIPGEGLGLAIARVIMAKCGGDITAASDLGRGSTFTFRLPTTL